MHSDSDANGKDVTTSKTDGKSHYYEWLLLECSSGRFFGGICHQCPAGFTWNLYYALNLLSET